MSDFQEEKLNNLKEEDVPLLEMPDDLIPTAASNTKGKG
jgi:hypothetical protein